MENLDLFLAKTVTGISLDSRLIRRGEAYVALQGDKFDGHAYITEAIKKGARVILAEKQVINVPKDMSVIVLPDLKKQLPDLASNFYRTLENPLKAIGITGTNGKTSCAYFLAHVLSILGKHCGYIGTLGTGFLDSLRSSTLTTPDIFIVHKTLAKLKKKQAKMVAIEASSVALALNRLNNVPFEYAVFTNLTRDHLDVHQTMEAYFEAKKKLFFDFSPRYSLVNLDDPYGQELSEKMSQEKNEVYGYSVHQPPTKKLPTLWVEGLMPVQKGYQGILHTPFGKEKMFFPVLGTFNVSNLLTVIGVACLEGFALSQVVQAISQVNPVPGRMCVHQQENTPKVVIDFAHTPDALENALLALKKETQGKLWCVVGCGGDRDKGKRPLMGKIAESYADEVFFTEDNPRSEKQAAIFSDMLAGVLAPKKINLVFSREKAIRTVIQSAKNQDVILLAGKGNERSIEVDGKKIPYCETTIVEEALRARKR